MLGQDPYHNGSATGIAFSVEERGGPKVLRELNPSLLNIRKEVENCGYQVENGKGDLTYWVKQGVFLINTALTVRESLAESHLNEWKIFTKELIKYISTNKKKVVYLLLGGKAQQYQSYFNKSKEHIVVKTSHPSPLSARLGFLGSECFKEVNEYLVAMKLSIIDWSIM